LTQHPGSRRAFDPGNERTSDDPAAIQGPSDEEKTRRLPWLYASDSLNSMFCLMTVFGSIHVLFLDEAGLDKARIGFLLSLFPFCGLLALFVARVAARRGFKRVFLACWASRKVVVALLVLTPWVLGWFGATAVFVFVTCVLILFAIFRAIGETAYFPWVHEFIPNPIRGRVGGINSVFAGVASMIAVQGASLVIGRFQAFGLWRFSWVIGAGACLGIMSVLCAARLPGGAPIPHGPQAPTHFHSMVRALRDRNFVLFLGCSGLLAFQAGLMAFLPLFLKEQAGLGKSTVIQLQLPTIAATLLSSYLWGRRADYRGGKSTALIGVSLGVVLPVCWWLIPRHTAHSVGIAMVLAFASGLAAVAMGVGTNRLLFVSVVPAQKKTEYMAIHYAWMGLVGGSAPLLAGRLVSLCRHVRGRVLGLPVGPYLPMFVGAVATAIAAIVVLSRLRSDRPTAAKPASHECSEPRTPNSP